MTSYDLNQKLISSKINKYTNIHLSSNKDNILCKHCKRTANNGIRCLGICVADNDY